MILSLKSIFSYISKQDSQQRTMWKITFYKWKYFEELKIYLYKYEVSYKYPFTKMVRKDERCLASREDGSASKCREDGSAGRRLSEPPPTTT